MQIGWESDSDSDSEATYISDEKWQEEEMMGIRSKSVNDCLK